MSSKGMGKFSKKGGKGKEKKQPINHGSGKVPRVKSSARKEPYTRKGADKDGVVTKGTPVSLTQVIAQTLTTKPVSVDAFLLW
jgi:hypothetical protein